MSSVRQRCLRLAATALTTGCLPVALLPAVAGASVAAAVPAGVISVGVPAIAVAVDPATDTGYTWAKLYGDPVNVINMSTGAIEATVAVPYQSESTRQVLAVDPDTDTVYVCSYNNDTVTVIDGATNTVTQTISVQSPTAVAVDPATDTIYVARRAAGVAVIDGATGAITATLPTDYGVTALAVDPATDTLYAAESLTSDIAVVDGATDTVTARIPDIVTLGLADDPASNVLYSLDGSAVNAYDGSTNMAAGSTQLSAPAEGIAVNPATDTIYAAAGGSQGQVALISGSTGLVTGSLALAASQLASDPASDSLLAASGTDAYVADLQAPEIGTSNGATFTVGESQSVTIPASGTPAPVFTESGKLPAGLALAPDGVLSGTAKSGTAGSYPITINAANGVSPAATQSFRIVVNQRPAFVSGRHATFQVRVEHRVTIQATGSPAPTVTEKGKLPAGLRFARRTDGRALISGRAARSTRGKVYVITLIAANGVGKPARQRLTIRIR
jgi:YVTN family beta-propeller protein